MAEVCVLTESLSFDFDKMPSSWVVLSTCVIDMALERIADWRGSWRGMRAGRVRVRRSIGERPNDWEICPADSSPDSPPDKRRRRPVTHGHG